MSENYAARKKIESLATEGLGRVDRIRKQLEARRDEADTASVNWGHAGDLGYVVEQLEKIDAFLSGEAR